MDDLTFSQELDRFAYVIVCYYPEDVVIGTPGFLFCCHIFMKVCDHIALGLEFAGIKGNAACGLRPDSGGMVNIIGSEALFYQLLGCEVPGQLMDNGGDHFQMC